MSDTQLLIERWVEHGGAWRCSPTRSGSIEVELCSCTGETQERLSIDDSRLVARLTELEPGALLTHVP